MCSDLFKPLPPSLLYVSVRLTATQSIAIILWVMLVLADSLNRCCTRGLGVSHILSTCCGSLHTRSDECGRVHGSPTFIFIFWYLSFFTRIQFCEPAFLFFLLSCYLLWFGQQFAPGSGFGFLQFLVIQFQLKSEKNKTKPGTFNLCLKNIEACICEIIFAHIQTYLIIFVLLNEEKQNNRRGSVCLCNSIGVWPLTHSCPNLSSADRDPDLLPADVPPEVALPGSEEQDLHRGPSAVLHGHGPAGAQHHILPHESGHAVQEGTVLILLLVILKVPYSTQCHICIFYLELEWHSLALLMIQKSL